MRLVVNYGGGTNSTAMLIQMARKGWTVDAVLFADTGGEKPRTYDYVRIFSAWLKENGLPEIVVVRNDGMYGSLEENCIVKEMLPSVVYGDGMRSCSDKYKVRPMDKWLKAKGWLKGPGKVTRCLGFHAGEAHRAKRMPDSEVFMWRFPLIEWDMDYDDCRRAIQDVGLPNPMKSACFFCPATPKAEVRALAKDHPDLFARAVEMERNAAPQMVKIEGLGRKWSWEEVAAADREQLKLFPEPIIRECVWCWDGDEE